MASLGARRSAAGALTPCRPHFFGVFDVVVTHDATRNLLMKPGRGTAAVTRARHSSGAGTKSGRFPKGKQNVPAGNPIVDMAAAKAAAVAVLKDLLPKDKCAWELHILTGAGLSTCQKLLSGHRELNFDTALPLLRSEYGYEVLRELLGDNPPRWFEQLENLDDIAKLKSDQLRMARDLERRERILIEARAQR